jgi:hypothetical protein
MIIPEFSLDIQFSPETARIDRLKASFSMGTIHATAYEKIDEVRQRLSNHDIFPEGESKIFTVPVRYRNGRKPLTIRKTPILFEGISAPPLFGGELNFTSYVRSGPTKSDLKFDLDFSVSRFARGQEPLQSPLDTSPALFARPLPCPQGEYSLDGSDNWLLAGAQDRQFSPAYWEHFEEESLSLINATVQARVYDALREAIPNSSLSGDIGACLLHSVEPYWEMACERPVFTLKTGIIPLLKNFGVNFAVTEYQPPSSVRETPSGKGKCPSVSIEMAGGGIFLKVYAKTDRRLRFEVAFDLEKNPAPIERISAETGERTRSRQADDIGEMRGFLSILRQKAAHIMNRAFSFMRSQATIIPNQPDEVQMIFEIAGAVKNRFIAMTIMDLLRVRGSIASTGWPKPMKSALRALAKAGILDWSRDKLYRATPRYSQALRTLMERRDSVLSTRVRPRPSLLPYPFDARTVSAAPAAHGIDWYLTPPPAPSRPR